MTLRSRKQAVRGLLSERRLSEVQVRAASERNALRTLMSLTFDAEELIRWRAIEAIGPVAADQAKVSLDRVREFLRHLFWLMNDESGGISWRSPEIIGEVLRNVPTLIDEYALLLPSFLREEPFERGTHLAIWRVADIRPEIFGSAVEKLGQSLSDSDPAIRAYAARAIMMIDTGQTERISLQLNGDDAGFSCYDFEGGELRQTTVARTVARRYGSAALQNRRNE